MAALPLNQMFQKTRCTRSDINEHCDKVRELASQAGSRVGFGMRHGVLTVALLARQPQKMTCHDLNHDPIAELLKSRQGKTAFSFAQGDSLSADIETSDLRLIDTRLQQQAHSQHIRTRIALLGNFFRSNYCPNCLTRLFCQRKSGRYFDKGVQLFQNLLLNNIPSPSRSSHRDVPHRTCIRLSPPVWLMTIPLSDAACCRFSPSLTKSRRPALAMMSVLCSDRSSTPF
jgi:hypothetical protein